MSKPDPHALFAALAVTESPENDPLRVLLALNSKFKALSDAITKLRRVLGRATDPGLIQELQEELQNTVAERALCDSRMQAIRAQGPFTNPGGPEEQNLLDAIRRVGAIVATVEAANALMGAVRGLIAAYSAATTEG